MRFVCYVVTIKFIHFDAVIVGSRWRVSDEIAIRTYVIIWQDKIVSAFCPSNYIWCAKLVDWTTAGGWLLSFPFLLFVFFFVYGIFFLTLFLSPSITLSCTRAHNLCPHSFRPFRFSVWVKEAAQEMKTKKSVAINICFYVRRQKLLRRVMSTF